MKYVEKQESPTFFEDWKEANDVETPEKAALKIWDILRNPEKGMLRTHLLKEQGYLCCYCYCTQRLIDNPLKTKIEHLYPKDDEKYPEKRFTYENLMLACNGGERDDPVIQHCDAKKGNQEPTLVHPFQHDCAEQFIYNALGEIDGDSTDAKTTITVLGLDIPKLNRLRAKAIGEFILQVNLESEEELNTELQLLTTKVDDKYGKFCTAVFQFIKNGYG